MYKPHYVLAFFLCLITAPAWGGVSVGETVDSFRLRDLDGTFHSDADYRGKVLVLAVIGYN